MYYKLENLPFHHDLMDVPSAEVMVLNATFVNGSCFVILVRNSPQIYINLNLHDSSKSIVLMIGEAKIDLGIHKTLQKMYRLPFSSRVFLSMVLDEKVSIKVENEIVVLKILK